MHIADTLTQLLLPPGPERQRLSQELRPGQILQATVLGPGADAGLRIRLGSLELTVRTPLRAEPGQTLEVEIVQGGEQPQVRLLPPAPANAATVQRLLQLLLPPGPERAQLAETLQPGQILRATLVNPQQTPVLKLHIAGLELTARLPLAPAAQRELALEVIRGGDTPELKLLTTARDPAAPLGERLLQLILPPAGQRPAWLQSLRPGQLLQATVAAPPTGDSPGLRIGDLVLPLRAAASYSTGQQLLLQVVRAGKMPELRPLRLPGGTEAQLQALRQALPNQRAPHELFQALRDALARAPTTTMPPTLLQGVERVLAQAVTTEDGLSAGLIRQAFTASGLFLEALLATGQPPATDFKDSLLRLLLLLRPLVKGADGASPQATARARAAAAVTADASWLTTLEELLHQTEGGLARLRLHQLASLPGDDPLRQAWQFELPVQHPQRNDSFWLRFERERDRTGDPAATVWKLTLNFDLPPLGRIESRLRLQGEEISTLFRAEQAASVALLERHLPRLNEALQRAGLTVGRLHAMQGQVPPPAVLAEPTRPTLLDERA